MVVCYIKTSHDTGELPRSIVDVIFTLKRLGYFNPLKKLEGGGGELKGVPKILATKTLIDSKFGMGIDVHEIYNIAEINNHPPSLFRVKMFIVFMSVT